MTTQQASLGRNVLVFVEPGLNNGADVAPATIVRVWPDGKINLRVHLDSMNPDLWLTSVPLFADRASAEQETGPRSVDAPGAVARGRYPFAAFWPPRV